MPSLSSSSTCPSPTEGSRPVLSLDGTWRFSYEGPAGQVMDATIPVPGIWQAHFETLRNSTGTGTYARDVTVPDGWAGRRLVLVLEGVFHDSEVAIDGTKVAAHANGWTPIEVDITEAVGSRHSFGITVTARVPDDRDRTRPGFGTALHAKQDWYGLQGGIWKSVRLEARVPAHLAQARVRAETDLTRHHIVVEATLSEPMEGALAIVVERAGQGVARHQVAVSGRSVRAEVALDAVELWSPDTPALYEVSLALQGPGGVVDTVARPVGFRLFEAREGRLWLNGGPFTMMGALDQDWYPEEECRPSSSAFLEQRFERARQIGLNTLRCHVKIPDPLYFELADRLGLIVWLDMPYAEFLAPQTRAQTSETFEQAVLDHGHHPCIGLWTIMNEGWGIDLDDNPDDRAWLAAEFDRLKRLVPTGLVVDNSPCNPRNYHVKTDVEDFHWYNSWPSQNAVFDATTQAFANRPAWSWSPHGDAQRRGDEPLVCSEFGVWGLPHPDDIRERDGREPWWFETGHEWNQGCGYPHGIETRFRDAALTTQFGSLKGFVDAAQDTQGRGLKFQIESLRWADLSGYIITELNDTQWEANGLMDAQNNLRGFADRLTGLQTPWLVIARPQRTALRPGEVITVPVRLAGAGPLPKGATLAWRFGIESGTLPLIPAATGSAEAGLALAAPEATAMQVLSLKLTALDAAGRVLSRNSAEFCVVPPLAAGPSLYPADPAAAGILKAVGWPAVVASADAAEVLLATRMTTPVREHLLGGGQALLVANDETALIDPARTLPHPDLVNFPKMQVKERDLTPWDGRWMGAFSWRRTDGPWSGLPNGPMLDEHWGGLIPRHVITGFHSSAFRGLVDAGVTVAWIHKAAAFSKRSFLGRGWITVTTFAFGDEDGQANPLAPHLLAALALS